MYVRGYQNRCPMEKNHKTAKNLVKLPYSAQKVLLRVWSLLLFFVMNCWLFKSKQWYRLCCKSVETLLTPTETRLKYPRYRQIKGFTNFFTFSWLNFSNNVPILQSIVLYCTCVRQATKLRFAPKLNEKTKADLLLYRTIVCPTRDTKSCHQELGTT